MRVLMTNNYYYIRGGAERVVMEEQALLESHGHTVVPFARSCPEMLSSPYERYFPRLDDWRSAVGFRKVRVALRMIYNRSVRRSLAALLRQVRPDVVHAHNIYGGLTTAVLDAAWEMHVPVVMTLHDLKLMCPSYLMLNHGKVCERCMGGRFFHCTLTRCHKESLAASLVYTAESYFNKWLRKYEKVAFFVCPSRFMKQKLLESGIKEKRCVYIPNFVDATTFTPSLQVGQYALYLGRLSQEKGVFTLLKAFEGLTIPLRIVGAGPMQAKLESHASEKRMSHVSFEGYRSGEELKNLIQNAAFVVMPSKCYENAPMTILEAYAHAKPVIGACIGGIPEMIEDGQTGMLFRPGHVKELRDAILTLWRNPRAIREMGNQVRRKVEREFSPEVHYEKLAGIYQRVIQASRAGQKFSKPRPKIGPAVETYRPHVEKNRREAA